jgi:hypothetical protein
MKPADLSSADQALLDKLNVAVAAANEAEKTAEAAKDEHVSRSRVVGQLLLEAKKCHPKKADFDAFVSHVVGLKQSRIYDLLRLAGGRATEEELRKEARERKQKSRTKKKLQPPHSPSLPKAVPDTDPPHSVTSPHVTESQEISIDQRTDMAALDMSAEEKAAKMSAHYLAEFTVACRTYLPKITVEADRQKARLLVAELTTDKKAEAA